MNPVLIFTDTRKIADEKKALNNAMPLFQVIYNEFKALSIQVSLQEISDLVFWTLNRNGGTNFVQEFAINKRLDANGPYALGGISLGRDKIRSMMDLPDVSNINSSLNTASNLQIGNGTRIDLFSLSNDIISKVSNSDAQIEAIYTYYTKTDASATLATNLLTVCASMNTFNANNNNLMLKNLSGIGNEQQFDIDLPGIAIFANSYVPSLKFIRSFEARQAA